MRSKFRPAALLLVTSFSCVAFVAACSGGGGSASPCCTATGSVEQAPAAVPTPTLHARPFEFDATSDNNLCPKLDAMGLDAGLLGLVPAGKAVDVDATGHYTISLRKKSEGKRIVVVIYADAPKGLVLLNSPLAASTDGSAIQIGPAGLIGATHVGESILELATLCHLVKNDLVGTLSPSDIRAFITRDVAANFTPGPANAVALATGIKAYGDSIAAFESGAPDTNAVDLFRTLREKAEAAVDRCRNGAEVSAGCDDTLQLDWEWYRYWKMGREAGPLGLTTWGNNGNTALAIYHLQAWAQTMNDAIGTIAAPETDHPYALSFLRQSYMLRAEIAALAIENATALPFDTRPGVPISLTLATAGLASPADSFHDLRIAIASDNTTAAIETAWDKAAAAVVANIERQGGFDPGGMSAMTALYNGSDKPAAIAAQGALNSTSPYDQVFKTIYTASAAAGEWGKVRADLDTAGAGTPPEVIALPAPQKDRLADILYFTSASAVPLQ